MGSTLIFMFFFGVVLCLSVLVSVAFLTLLERKIIAATHNRKGPNHVGIYGFMQPFADAAKLILKEAVLPHRARALLFAISPLISLFFALIPWAFIPFSYQAIISNVNIAFFFIFSSSILHIYGIILAGWSSGSRYSFLGAIRSSAQLIAYDISIGLNIATIALFPKSFSLLQIVEFQDFCGWFIFILPGSFVLFVVSGVAETNRHPYDLPEAESELVGGFNTEYSSAPFACFFLGEYASVLLMVFLINHLYLGGWISFSNPTLAAIVYFIKILALYYGFVFLRAAIPRYRYDQLMRLGWKVILPLSLAFFVVISIIVLSSENLPTIITDTYNLLNAKISSTCPEDAFVDKQWYCETA